MQGVQALRRHAKALRDQETAVHALENGSAERLLKAIPSALEALVKESSYVKMLLDQEGVDSAGSFEEMRLRQPSTAEEESRMRSMVTRKLLTLKADLRALASLSALYMYDHAQEKRTDLPPRDELSGRHRALLEEVFGADKLWIVDPEMQEDALTRLEGKADNIGPWDLLRIAIGLQELQAEAQAELVAVLSARRTELDATLGISAEAVLRDGNMAEDELKSQRPLRSQRGLAEVQSASQHVRAYERFLRGHEHLVGLMTALRAYRDGVKAMEVVNVLRQQITDLRKENRKLTNVIRTRDKNLEEMLDSSKASTAQIRTRRMLDDALKEKDALLEALRRQQSQCASFKVENNRLRDEAAAYAYKVEERNAVIVQNGRRVGKALAEARRKSAEVEAAVTDLRINQDLLSSVLRKAKHDSQGVQLMLEEQRKVHARDRAEMEKWNRDRLEVDVEARRRLKMMKVAAAAALAAQDCEKEARHHAQQCEKEKRDAMDELERVTELHESALERIDEQREDLATKERRIAELVREGHLLRARLAARTGA
eukprot:scaffold2473_cov247-Pinguiococcus_pyrenoidosus.AAC.1